MMTIGACSRLGEKNGNIQVSHEVVVVERHDVVGTHEEFRQAGGVHAVPLVVTVDKAQGVLL